MIGLPELHSLNLGAGRHDLKIQATAIAQFIGLVAGLGLSDLHFG
jgi:hypothetical protein